jgi:RNA polymerase sigma factor (sigma-70 family)
LYSEYAQAVFRFLVYRTGDQTLSEDLLADTYERVLTTRRRPSRADREKAWLFAIALNLVRDNARRAKIELRAVDRVADRGGGESEWEAVETRDRVARALTTLTVEEREAIALRFGADLSVPQIARALGVPLTTAEGRVYSAQRKLRDQLS